MKYKWLLLSIVVLAFITVGCPSPQQEKKQSQEPKQQEVPKMQEEEVTENKLLAININSPPVLDGLDEAIWDKAKPIKVELEKAGGIRSEVLIKALYDSENLYMQLKWADSTESLARGPWVKEGQELVLKPFDEFYEDKVALLWNIDDSVKDFSKKGCSVACHVTSAGSGQTISKHYTNAKEERLDLWQWRATLQNTLFGPEKPGLMHDQFVDNKNYEPETNENAGRHSDPGERESTINANSDRSQPLYVFEAEPKNGNPYVIVEGMDQKRDFEAAMVAKMNEGDFIPGVIAFQLTGDPADIAAKGKYEKGSWILEIKRKLETTSDKDIQFKDLSREYFFAISAFDNSKSNHAYQSGVQRLMFQK